MCGSTVLLICLRILFFLDASTAEFECSVELEQYNDLDPCEFDSDIITNLGPCDGIMSGLELISEPPMIHWPEAEVEKKYVIFMVDADAPTPSWNYNQYYIMWYITGVKGIHLLTGDIAGETIIFSNGGYLKPFSTYNPYGVHRYQIYLFEPIGVPSISYDVYIREQLNFTRWAFKYNACLRAAYQIYGTFEFTPTAIFWDDFGRKTRSTPLTCGVDSLFFKTIKVNLPLSLMASFLAVLRMFVR